MSDSIDYDGAWKEALDFYLQPFLELCFPEIAARIDWTVPVELLDKELQKIVWNSNLGRQFVDKLFKVRLRDGTEEWVLVHLEVQSQPDEGLPKRMYQYHHRIVDRFGCNAATLVVLADARAHWRPNSYEEELFGCKMRFEFPVCKLLDLDRGPDALETRGNPAAIMVAAHLTSQASHGNMTLRDKRK